MILLYTGAESPNAEQLLSDKSLGGYVSSTSIPNGRLSNVFSQISKDTVLNDKEQVRLIVLKNTTENDIENITIYTDTENSSSLLRIAVVLPFVDCETESYEKVFDSYSLPYQATFDFHAVDNPVTVDILQSGKSIGIWLLRSVNKDKFPDLLNNLTGDALIEAMKTERGNETINLLINF